MRSLAFLLLGLSVTESACENRKAEAATASASAAVVTAATSPTGATAANDPATRVGKIIFVGKEHACDCTRKKVDTALAALQKLLGAPPKIPVEMLKVDVEEARVEPYRKQRPMMAIPAIYFVDRNGSVIDMLQGEITEEQIAGALDK